MVLPIYDTIIIQVLRKNVKKYFKEGDVKKPARGRQ